MILIICPECSNEFPEIANQCPNCGIPKKIINLIKMRFEGDERNLKHSSFFKYDENISIRSFNEDIKNWIVSYGGCIKTLKGHTKEVTSVGFFSNGEYIVSGSRDCTIKIWKTDNGECIKTLKGHTDSITSIYVSNDGSYIVSGSLDKIIKVWDVESGKVVKNFEGHDNGVIAVYFSTDNQFIISGDVNAIKIWRIKDCKCIRTESVCYYNMTSVCLSSIDKYIVIGSDSGLIDPVTGPLIYSLQILKIGDEKFIKKYEKCMDEVHTVTTSKDDRYIALGSYNEIQILRIVDGECIKKIKFEDVKYSPNTRYNFGDITSIAFSPKGNYLVSNGLDLDIMIWRVKDGKCIKILKGHNDYVNTVSFSIDGEHIVSGSRDNTIKIWKVGNLLI